MFFKAKTEIGITLTILKKEVLLCQLDNDHFVS